MSATSPNLASMVSIGRETPDEVKTEAFRVWIENGRSWKRTSEVTGVAISTLHHWATTEDWQQRRRDQAAAFLPGMTTETAFALKLAAHNASLRLQQIAWEANELGTKPDTKEVQALSLIVDRGGHSPVGKQQPTEVTFADPAQKFDVPSLVGMSPDELMRLEQQTREKQR